MHRHDRIERQQIVEQSEYRFLHFAGVSGATYQDELLGEVYRDHGFAARAVPLRIGLETGQVDDRIFRNKGGKFVGFGSDQPGADDQVVARPVR